MKKIFLVLLFISLLFQSANSQNDRLDTQTKDSLIIQKNPSGESNQYKAALGILLIAFSCVMIGTIIVGAFAVVFILLSILVLISIGVLSTSIIAGLYKKSIAYGFKTFLLISCSCFGGVIGAVSLFFISKIEALRLTHQTSLIIGTASGLIGGILMGLIVFKLLQLFLNYFKQKFRLN